MRPLQGWRIFSALLVGGLVIVFSINNRPLLQAESASAQHENSNEVRPFRIHIDNEVLEDLEWRLLRTRFPQAIEGSGWTYGTDVSYLKTLVEYWHTDFDWRKEERELNQFPQFKTTID